MRKRNMLDLAGFRAQNHLQMLKRRDQLPFAISPTDMASPHQAYLLALAREINLFGSPLSEAAAIVRFLTDEIYARWAEICVGGPSGPWLVVTYDCAQICDTDATMKLLGVASP
jgi:hypothetical protein